MKKEKTIILVTLLLFKKKTSYNIKQFENSILG